MVTFQQFFYTSPGSCTPQEPIAMSKKIFKQLLHTYAGFHTHQEQILWGLMQIKKIKQFVAKFVYGSFIHFLGLLLKSLSKQCTKYTGHAPQSCFHLYL